MTQDDLRRTEQGHTIDATIVRSFIRAALEHDAVAEEAHDLLFEHVVEGRYHPTAVAASLRPILVEVLDAASEADWRHVASDLIAEPREALVEAEPGGPGTHLRTRFWPRHNR
jgi:hypothetical protein